MSGNATKEVRANCAPNERSSRARYERIQERRRALLDEASDGVFFSFFFFFPSPDIFANSSPRNEGREVIRSFSEFHSLLINALAREQRHVSAERFSACTDAGGVFSIFLVSKIPSRARTVI